jgi:hypothetical protein
MSAKVNEFYLFGNTFLYKRIKGIKGLKSASLEK